MTNFAPMLLYPNAKINLGLNVLAKREDGFHTIETVFCPIAWSDMLEVLPDETKEQGITLSTSGIKIEGAAEDNLCVKAYQLIAKDYALPAVKAHLHKIIPTGAGLGGGSSDAAFFIRALNEIFQLHLAWGELHHYAKQLGADCSFFIINKPCFAEGKGDDLERLDFSPEGLHLVVVHPGIHVSTKEAYANIVPAQPEIPLKEIIGAIPVEKWKEVLRNDFEATVFKKFPAIAALRKKLYDRGAVYASMSGSGSAVYGLFREKTDLKKEFSGCSVWEETWITS